MSFGNLIAMFILFFLLSATNVFALETNQKYLDIFYPDGMPVKNSIYGQGPTSYQLYDELPIPDTDLIVVLFSENIITLGAHSDTKYSVFISILQPTNGVLRIKHLQEITDYFLRSSEEAPGYIRGMGGILSYFSISDDAKAVNLCMAYTILSDSNKIETASDIIFLIGDDELVPVLALIEDGLGTRSGTGYSAFTYAFVYLADTDSDGSMDIVTQEYNYENNGTDENFIGELSPDLNVYKYNSTEEKYELKGQITSLPADAIKLNRGPEPDVDALTKAGCCSGN